jgi:hypothetical protein
LPDFLLRRVPFGHLLRFCEVALGEGDFLALFLATFSQLPVFLLRLVPFGQRFCFL